MSMSIKLVLGGAIVDQSFPVLARCTESSLQRKYGSHVFPPEYAKGELLEIHGVAIATDSYCLLVAPQGAGIDSSEYVAITDLPSLEHVK